MIIKGKITKKDLKAIDIFANLLFSPQLKRHIEITIVYRKNVAHFGLTDIEEYNLRGIPRSFVVEIQRGLDETERLRTIAHEMVHVKQYAKKELNGQMTLWHGQPVDADKIPYFDQPWEIEANDVGDFLFEEYMYGNV